MKWYHESIGCKNQPDNIIMSLIGRYNDDPNKHMITIELIIDEYIGPEHGPDLLHGPNSKKRSYICMLPHVTMFEKSPSLLAAENPSADDIFNKYRSQILKIRKKVAAKEYSELVKK